MKATSSKKILYLSYDGLSDHIGQSQVLPYLLACKARGINFGLLTFEKASKKDKVMQIQSMLDEQSISWHHITFSEGGNFSKVKDFLKFVYTAFRLCNKGGYSVVHSRSYTASCIGLLLKVFLGKKLIFDKRDFWIDAKIETGRLLLYKPSHRFINFLLRGFEKRLFLQSDHIISLTEKAKQLVLAKYPSRKPDEITVIPCCVDLQLFNPENVLVSAAAALRQKLGLVNAYVLGYVGSIDKAYMIPELLDCFNIIRAKMPATKLLFLVNNNRDEVLRLVEAQGIPREGVAITSASREDMPLYISMMDCGFYFISPTYAKQASSPTKLAEMLALGKPVITNRGVGDAEKIFSELGCGYLVSSFTATQYNEAADWLQKNQRCQSVYDLSGYSLEFGANQYYRVYQKILA